MQPSDVVAIISKWLLYLERELLYFDHAPADFVHLVEERRRFVELRRDAEAAAARWVI